MGWSLSPESIARFYGEWYNYLWICGKSGLETELAGERAVGLVGAGSVFLSGRKTSGMLA